MNRFVGGLLLVTLTACGSVVEAPAEVRFESHPDQAADSAVADADAGSCQPATCALLDVECGVADDGCGALVDCGGCTTGSVCIDHTCSSH